MGVDSPVETAPAKVATDAPAQAGSKVTTGRGRKPSTARKTRAVELTLTVTGTADGEWQAELIHQGERVVQALPVAAAAVARAARELHPDVHATIESVLAAAREQHRVRMEQLEAELDKVRLALADLAD